MLWNGFNANPMDRLTMGKIVLLGLCYLRTFFGTYEQFISVLWNIFFY